MGKYRERLRKLWKFIGKSKVLAWSGLRRALSSIMKKWNKLYTIECTEWKPDAMQKVIKEDDAVLVDTRMEPTSETRHWCKDQLQELVGKDQYVHLDSLASVSTGKRGQIKLNAPQKALAPISKFLSKRPDARSRCARLAVCTIFLTLVILMFGGGKQSRGHRRVAAKYIARNLSVPGFTHLSPNGVKKYVTMATPDSKVQKSNVEKKKSKGNGTKTVPLRSAEALVDIGINVYDSSETQIKEMLSRANEANVPFMLLTGTSMKVCSKMIKLAEKHRSSFRCTVGVHPHHAKEFKESSIKDLRALAKSSKMVCAIGECGLDFNRNFSKKEEQLFAFREQVKLAIELKMPMFVHERDAHEDLVKVLSEFEGKLPPVCIHCFTGSAKEAKRYIKDGYYIGITGFVAKKKRGAELREIVSSGYIPLKRLMIETDSPYMCPDDKRCKRFMRGNEPCTLPIVAETLAGCYNVSFADFGKTTTETTRTFFSLPEIESATLIKK